MENFQQKEPCLQNCGSYFFSIKQAAISVFRQLEVSFLDKSHSGNFDESVFSRFSQNLALLMKSSAQCYIKLKVVTDFPVKQFMVVPLCLLESYYFMKGKLSTLLFR